MSQEQDCKHIFGTMNNLTQVTTTYSFVAEFVQGKNCVPGEGETIYDTKVYSRHGIECKVQMKIVDGPRLDYMDDKLAASVTARSTARKIDFKIKLILQCSDPGVMRFGHDQPPDIALKEVLSEDLEAGTIIVGSNNIIDTDTLQHYSAATNIIKFVVELAISEEDVVGNDLPDIISWENQIPCLLLVTKLLT